MRGNHEPHGEGVKLNSVAAPVGGAGVTETNPTWPWPLGRSEST